MVSASKKSKMIGPTSTGKPKAVLGRPTLFMTARGETCEQEVLRAES
jgi:hypothetical protein